MTPDEAQRRLSAAARYRDMARFMFDKGARAALFDTAAEFERTASPIVALPGDDTPVAPRDSNSL